MVFPGNTTMSIVTLGWEVCNWYLRQVTTEAKKKKPEKKKTNVAAHVKTGMLKYIQFLFLGFDTL